MYKDSSQKAREYFDLLRALLEPHACKANVIQFRAGKFTTSLCNREAT